MAALNLYREVMCSRGVYTSTHQFTEYVAYARVLLVVAFHYLSD